MGGSRNVTPKIKNQSFYISDQTKRLMKKNAEAMTTLGIPGLFNRDGEVSPTPFLRQSMIVLDKLFSSMKKDEK